VADAGKGRDGAVPRRVRAAGPRDRSGPIGITSGDFSTPVVRKRTTTQPRGIPVLAAQSPLAAAAAAAAAAEVVERAPEQRPTPAPETTSMGAVPASPVVEATPGAISTRPPPPPLSSDDSPFSDEAAEEDLPQAEPDTEAAALAAEAAAVRALDIGPMTPPPELLPAAAAPPAEVADAPLTPPPEVVAVAQPAGLEIAAPTPPPEVRVGALTPPPEVGARTPPPEVPVNGMTPRPSVSAGARTPAPEFPTVVRTPPPDLIEASRTPAPASAFTPPPEVAFEDLPTPPPQIVVPHAPSGDDGLPVAGIEADDGDASVVADLPAEALSDPESDAALAADADGDAALTEHEFDGDDVEVMDGTDQARAIEFAESHTTAPPPAPKYATPPPIPGAYLKTPGPEPVVMPGEASGIAIPVLPILPEALAQRPRRPKRSKPWFEEVFDEDYLRTLPFMRADQTLREVEFISEALRVGDGAEILDVACGYGRHAIELVQRGFNVTGLDLSLPLLIRAADEAQRRELAVNFVHADMREMAFEKQFDGAYSMLTSFGYFDEDTNLRVAERIGRALKPGARFLLDIVNRDYVVSDLPVRVWWEGTGCVVLEEVDFNFHTSRIVTHRSIVFEDGRQLEQELSVRAYSLHEIGRLLRQAGFRVMDVSGGLATRGQFFGAASRSLLIVAEKRESDSAQPL
jgi:SAM-dependent methyltransferase